jgi:rsbT co-antagonist protein RsbR
VIGSWSYHLSALLTRGAQQVLESLLTGVVEMRAQVVILDISGVSVVHMQVADALIRAAQVMRLRGAQVILTDIRPEVAQTLVGLDIDLQQIITRSTLQSGITYVLADDRALGRT